MVNNSRKASVFIAAGTVLKREDRVLVSQSLESESSVLAVSGRRQKPVFGRAAVIS
jgi:hypothetical protein